MSKIMKKIRKNKLSITFGLLTIFLVVSGVILLRIYQKDNKLKDSKLEKDVKLKKETKKEDVIEKKDEKNRMINTKENKDKMLDNQVIKNIDEDENNQQQILHEIQKNTTKKSCNKIVEGVKELVVLGKDAVNNLMDISVVYNFVVLPIIYSTLVKIYSCILTLVTFGYFSK